MKVLLQYLLTLFTIAVCVMDKLSTCQAKPLAGHHISNRRLRIIQDEILKKLGLSRVPDASKFNATVDEIRRMYKQYKKSVEDNKGRVHSLYSDEEYYAKKFHSFSGAPPVGSGASRWQSASSHLLHFPVDIPLPPEPNKETIVNQATLKLYKLRTKVPPAWAMREAETVDGPTTRINVYQLLEPMGGSRGGNGGMRDTRRPPRKRLLDSRLVTLDGAGWEKFDVRIALADWIEDPGTNHGLQVVCVSCVLHDTVEFALSSPAGSSDSSGGESGAAATMPVDADLANPEEDEDDVAPTLNVYTQDKTIIGRQKRSHSSGDYDCTGSGESRCCRYKMVIDFEEIGYDWIVEPRRYEAYYCKGSCPHRYKSAHRFVTIQSIIHQLNPTKVPSPCCIATKLEPLQLMHYNEHGRLVVTSMEDMLVSECKCG